MHLRKQILIITLLTFSTLIIYNSCKKDKTQAVINNTNTVAAVDSCSSVTYTKVVKAIVLNNCAVTGCHDASSSNGNFTTYAGLKSSYDNKTLSYSSTAILGKNQDMSSNYASLSTSQINEFICWLKNGAPNN
jgi:hypothetical protein